MGLRGDGIAQRFRALSALLQTQAELWRPVPFYLPVLPWESRHPALSRALRDLDEATAAALEANPPDLLVWLAEFLPGLADVEALTHMHPWPACDSGYPDRFDRDIPGRKWRQVSAFAAAVDSLKGPALEWCAGKGHLARAVSHRFQQPITGLERDPRLCREGNALSERLRGAVRLYQCDVMSGAAEACFIRSPHAIALHACGDLHRRLLTLCARHGGDLHLSPCCYHLAAGDLHRPLSRAGRRAGFNLTRQELRLAVQETVTAAGRVDRQRRRKRAWRLGFDALQRRVCGRDRYLPVPAMPEAAFGGAFADFCRHAAALKDIELPCNTDWRHYETLGWRRQGEVSRLELPRHAVRRALELYVVLDQALFLQEAGYRVRVGTFCSRRVTPRNLLLAAHRTDGRGSEDRRR
jgi:hypothetical protein